MVAGQMRPLAAKKNLALHLEKQRHSGGPGWWGDARRLQQVLIESGEQCDQVYALWRGAHCGDREDDGRQPEIVSISGPDSGTGIAPGDVAKLFQQFQQVNAFGSRKYGGSGLDWPSRSNWWN